MEKKEKEEKSRSDWFGLVAFDELGNESVVCVSFAPIFFSSNLFPPRKKKNEVAK